MRSARLLTFLFTFGATCNCLAQVTIAQISDTHIGEPRAPDAVDNLRHSLDIVNARHPDAVIVTGDMGEKHPDDWDTAKGILKWLKAPVYYVPGNHDVHTHDVDQYRAAFGQDYYRFRVKNVDFIVIDSQLLGNFEDYERTSVAPLPADTVSESKRCSLGSRGK